MRNLHQIFTLPFNFRFLFLVSLLLFVSCQTSIDQAAIKEDHAAHLFTTVKAQSSGIDFQNKLIETESSNYYKYMYSYIGAGVAAADFNNDGMDDLFFVSNQFDNKLYLNKGDLKFEDITEQAGIKKRKGFDAGVSIADINQDGWLDIYITRGGWIQDNNAFANMLFINEGVNNDGVPTFRESAKEHGLAEANRSIQATFFDYDKDGDLDVYISNTPDFEDPAAEVVDLTKVQNDPLTLEMRGSDKLYQNDGKGKFKDVSAQAGIMPDIGFGLNPQVGDLNGDGWLDIYVCNDFRIPDFVYINKGNGTFYKGRNELFKHMSFNSMGSDFADVNNDGLLDLYTLDMNPEDYIRSKTTMGMTPQNRFEEMVAKNYHYQYMHNMLQINNGNGSFREISKLAGVADTDWSWSCLLADFDLDGWNDAFVTNGVFRDVIDRDANNNILTQLRSKGKKPSDADFLAYAKMLPQQKLTNYFFRNNGDWTFENMSSSWTDSIPTFSNGATYSDLDNDGDLEIIVNNINQEATLLKNMASEKSRGDYLKVQLDGYEKNKEGIGTYVKLFLEDGTILVRQQIKSRGFLSSVSSTLHFGLKTDIPIQKLEVIWPDGRNQIITNVTINQKIKLSYADAQSTLPSATATTTLFQNLPYSFEHIDPYYNDYSQQILLPHKLSQTGPAVATADVNQDGLTDIYLGGGHTQPGQLLIAKSSGGFQSKEIAVFTKDKQYEDTGAAFFDADGDGDMDLYVVSGSYEFAQPSRLLADRFYINDGQGNFTKNNNMFPPESSAGAIARPADYDGDGDVDLFVGGRVVPGQYPYPPISFLYINEGNRFKLATAELAPDLERIGMVTDAIWTDIDQDQDLDLLVTGEWMGIEVFINENGKLSKSEQYKTLYSKVGWWNTLQLADVDQDGDQDIIAGNLGLNYKFHASEEKPFHVYTNDFDYNGTVDVFLAKYYKGIEVPVRGKTCTAQQMPHLAKKIATYNDFANKDLAGIIGPGIQNALHYEATEFRSGIFFNEGDRKYRFSAFENVAQQSPINGIIYDDLDGDHIPDLLMAGNNHMAEIETTRADAGIGIFLRGQGDGAFEAVDRLTSGFFAEKDVRHLTAVGNKKSKIILVVNNNDMHDWFEVKQLEQ